MLPKNKLSNSEKIGDAIIHIDIGLTIDAVYLLDSKERKALNNCGKTDRMMQTEVSWKNAEINDRETPNDIR